jgi:glycosyltransferase involved in cell wall biosynthesis
VAIYALVPDTDAPFGGVKQLYRHVDVLNRNGLPAAVLHNQPGFRCTWFANDTRIVHPGEVAIGPEDFVVVPEVWGPKLARLWPGVRKVIFNQNAYQTFRGYSSDPDDRTTPYRDPEVVATIVVSEDSRAYLEYAFPGHRVFRVRCGIDPAVFGFSAAKRPQIAFMPRKHAEDLRQLINLLKFRGALEGVRLVPIQRLRESEVAAILKESLLFLSVVYHEGFPLPPAEAMSCGCVVVGFPGLGGRESFRPEFSYPVPQGDILAFAKAAEAALALYRTRPAAIEALGRQASAFIAENYALEREEEDIVAVWRQLTHAPDP